MLVAALLPNVSAAGILHPQADFDYSPQIGRATAHFDVPEGWRALSSDQKMPHHATLVQITSKKKGDKIVVNLNFYHLHSFQIEKTQRGCALEYLDGIQRHADPDATMQMVDRFQSPLAGSIDTYRYSIAHLGQRWVAFVVEGDYVLRVEIDAPDLMQERMLMSYVALIAGGVSIKQPTETKSAEARKRGS